ncbi:hypothetical protein Nepgr_008814 [Nepenthes gracilis]|uniref:Uncharacterized protein n=1 Tax=Nepenthes gracilis TaxID=150966 RepID=A0AAD3XJM7_NEPGR|nr:hypothetical protein Nepgr_008814 [Nepenthes gracilis]
MEPMARKLSYVGRLIIHRLSKGMQRGKPNIDLHFMMKRGKSVAKAVGDLMVRHHYHATLACRSTDVHQPVKCRNEYEFSCSSSPAFQVGRSKKGGSYSRNFPYDKDTDNIHADIVGGFCHAPPVEAVIGAAPRWKTGAQESLLAHGCCVDWAAEKFIERFYEELRLQNRG